MTNKKGYYFCLFAGAVFLVWAAVFLTRWLIMRQEKWDFAHHMADITLNTPTFPAPVRVSSTETNYCQFMLTLCSSFHGNEEQETIEIEDIFRMVSPEIMQHYTSPLVDADRYRNDTRYDTADGARYCGLILVSNILSVASTGRNDDRMCLLCPRLQWIVDGFRQENQSILRRLAIEIETDIVQNFLDSGTVPEHRILSLLPFIKMNYFSGTCDLFTSELHESIDFSYKTYKRKKEQVRRSLQPVFDQLLSLTSMLNNNEEEVDAALLITELKKDLTLSSLTNQDKTYKEEIIDIALFADLQLHLLKRELLSRVERQVVEGENMSRIETCGHKEQTVK